MMAFSKLMAAGAGLAAAGSVAAFSIPHPQPVQAQPKTVAYYVAHPDEMNTMLASCRNDPGHARGTPECDNAHQAMWNRASDEANEFLRAHQ